MPKTNTHMQTCRRIDIHSLTHPRTHLHLHLCYNIDRENFMDQQTDFKCSLILVSAY